MQTVQIEFVQLGINAHLVKKKPGTIDLTAIGCM